MAYAGYGAKYTLTFSDVFQNTTGQYIATIYKKGYSGLVTEIDGDGSPLVIETDKSGDFGYRPVIASKASLNILIQDVNIEAQWTDNTNIWELYNLIFGYTGFDFTEFITAGADEFLLEVKIKSGAFYNIIWQGYYIYNSDVSISEIIPIRFTLQFSDFLQAKINRFYNFQPSDTTSVRYYPSDKISILEALMRCAYFSKITDTVDIEFPYSLYNTYIDGLGNEVYTENILEMFIQKNAFLTDLYKYQTIYDALSGICSQFGLIAYFKDNILCIKSYENLVNSTNRFTNRYQITGFNSTTDSVNFSYIDTITENDSIFPLNSSGFKNIGRDQSVRFSYPIEDVLIENKASKNSNTPNYTLNSVSQIDGPTADFWYAVNNWYLLDGREALYNYSNESYAMTISGQTIILPYIIPFSPYTNIKTATYGDKFATRFQSRTGFNRYSFIDSEPLSVNPGDTFAFSYSAFTDGRVKNLPTALYPNVVIALILQANAEDGSEVTYYYDYTTNKFITGITNYVTQGTLPLIKSVDYIGDSDWIHYDIKGTLDIPSGAKLRIRHYTPYRTSAVTPLEDRYSIFINYCNLQTFKSSAVSDLPSSQTFTTKYDDLINSDESLTLNSNLFLMDGTVYVPDSPLAPNETKLKNPMFVPSNYGNHIFDEYYNPASGAEYSFANPSCIDISYATLKTRLTSISENILKNIGLTNCVIEGSYKSESNFGIGNKFSYQIVGYNPKTFVMLDYSLDVKNATYNCLLYSSEFSDDTGKVINTKTIIE